MILVDTHPRHAWLVAAVDKRLREELVKLQVEINEEKSRIVNLENGESFTFLGFEFRRMRSFRGVESELHTEAEGTNSAACEAQGYIPTI